MINSCASSRAYRTSETMPSRADRRYQEAPGLTDHSCCLPSSTRHSPELGIVPQVVKREVFQLRLLTCFGKPVFDVSIRLVGFRVDEDIFAVALMALGQ